MLYLLSPIQASDGRTSRSNRCDSKSQRIVVKFARGFERACTSSVCAFRQTRDRRLRRAGNGCASFVVVSSSFGTGSSSLSLESLESVPMNRSARLTLVLFFILGSLFGPILHK